MPDENDFPTHLIAGPTAAGKTAAALLLAESLADAQGRAAEIINADAMQVYRDIPILSAQPSQEEMAQVPHHLFGTVDGKVAYSTGAWASDVKDILNRIGARGNAAIIVGGTGLYFRALTEGLSPIPEVPEEIKSAAIARLDEMGVAAFRAEVIARDPAMARLEPADTQRHVRAWAVFEATDTPLSEFQALPNVPVIERYTSACVVLPDREALYARCDARLQKMIEAGALEEARQLRGRKLAAGLPVMKALGVKELIAHLDGEMSLDDAIALAQLNTRRFAKRQMTWFRNQTPDWERVESGEAVVASFVE